MPLLDLPESNHTKVWKLIVDLATNDPVLSRAIDTFLIPDGRKQPDVAQLSNMLPAMQLVPVMGPKSWYSVDEQGGDLIVQVTIAIQSEDAADLLNLWAAFEGVFYPVGDRPAQKAITARFRERGAETGEVLFSIPASLPDPQFSGDGITAARGEIRLVVNRCLNP